MKKIDITRYIMAFLVVMIHVFVATKYTSTSSIGWFLVNTICRIAVPFFFICTGYFSDFKSTKTIKRLIILYVVWSIIYFPIEKFNVLLFLFDKSVFHLWYIVDSIRGLLIIYFLNKKLDTKIIMISSFILYLACYLLGINTTVFFSLFMLCLGNYLHHGEILKKYRVLLLIIFFVFLVLEAKYINFASNDVVMRISTIPIAAILFSLLKTDNISKGIPTIRKMSSLIYFSHVLIIYWIVPITHTPWLSLISLFLIASTISFVIVKLSEIKYLEFLKYLY